MRYWSCYFALFCVAVIGTHASGQPAGRGLVGDFEMVDALGNVTALVQASRGDLRFRLRSGERRQYNREARYDSPDGRFIGYTNFELNRVLRFPITGRGGCWVADLDDRFPQFRALPQVVRPIRGGIATGQIPSWGFGSPYVPSYGPGNFGSGNFGYSGFGNGGFQSGPVVVAPSYSAGYRPQPRSVLLESRTVPNPPLAPVRLRLLNPTKRTLQVAIVDVASPSGNRSMKIPAGQSSEVQISRDSGAKRVSRYQTFDALGYPIEKEVITEIPPVVRYEIVVHEWAMQSVAIDRTGKSPNVIEDINMQGRGLGRFPLPPGDALRPGTIDVYRAAVNAGNQGAIAPIVPTEDGGPGQPTDNASALENAVLEAQRRAMSGRSN